MATQQTVIRRFMDALDYTKAIGTAAFDDAVRTCSNYSSAQEVVNALINDCLAYNAADPVNGWQSFLRDKCGIILDNEDTGAITGSDAGGSTVKTSDSVIPEEGSLIAFTGNSFTAAGATFTLEKDFSELTDNEKFIWQCLYTWWAGESLSLIAQSYGYSFYDRDVSVRDITVRFINDSSIGLGAFTSVNWDNGTTYAISFTVNEAYYNNLDQSDYNGNYLDRLIVHELTHAVYYAKLNYGYELPIFLIEGLGDLTHGSDDDANKRVNISNLAKDPTTLLGALGMTSGMTAYTTGYPNYTYEAGYIFLRYLAKQAAEDTSDSWYTYTGGDGYISNYNEDRYIVLGAAPTAMTYYNEDFYFGTETGTLVIQNAMNKVIDFRDGAGNEFIKACATTLPTTIDGRGGDVFEFLVGSDYGSDTIFAGDGGSSLWGGAGNYDDQLIGGAGKDIFVCSKNQGSDVLTNVSSADEILLTETNIGDIIATNEQNNTLALTFDTGNTLLIGSTETLSAKINLADGTSWRFNHATRAWQQA